MVLENENALLEKKVLCQEVCLGNAYDTSVLKEVEKSVSYIEHGICTSLKTYPYRRTTDRAARVPITARRSVPKGAWNLRLALAVWLAVGGNLENVSCERML